MTFHYAQAPANVVTDPAGNVVTGWRLDVWDSSSGGTRVTDMTALDGTALPGYLTSDSEGRYPFARTNESLPVLWLDDGQSGLRWAVVAVEVSRAAGEAAGSATAAQQSASAAQQSASAAANSASSATAAASNAVTTANAALSEVDDYKRQTPTLEELMVTPVISQMEELGGGEGHDGVLLTAPFALVIRSVAIVWSESRSDQPASDTDYYTFTLATSEGAILARRTTQATGANAGGAISIGAPRTYSWANLSGVTLAAGVALYLFRSSTGSPSSPLYAPMFLTVGYAPA